MTKSATYLGALACAAVAIVLLASGDYVQAKAMGTLGLVCAAIYELS